MKLFLSMGLNYFILAEKERFELSIEFYPYTRLAGDKAHFLKTTKHAKPPPLLDFKTPLFS